MIQYHISMNTEQKVCQVARLHMNFSSSNHVRDCAYDAIAGNRLFIAKIFIIMLESLLARHENIILVSYHNIDFFPITIICIQTDIVS